MKIYNKQTNQILSCTDTDKYQAMLIAIGSHNWSASNNNDIKHQLWKKINGMWIIITMYIKKIENPKQIFTYMSR